jgi:hypothetical protein
MLPERQFGGGRPLVRQSKVFRERRRSDEESERRVVVGAEVVDVGERKVSHQRSEVHVLEAGRLGPDAKKFVAETELEINRIKVILQLKTNEQYFFFVKRNLFADSILSYVLLF